MGRRRQTTPSLGQTKTGAWRIRWRQDERQPDGSTKRVPRERQVATKAEAVRLQATIQQHLEERGYWLESDAVPSKPLDVSLADAYRQRVASKRTRWNPGASTNDTAFGEFKRFSAAWHVSGWSPARRDQAQNRPTHNQLESWALAGANEWISSLTEERFREASTILIGWYASSTAYNSAARGMDLWRFLERTGESGVSRPPAEAAEVLPPPPLHAPPSSIPTWADTDACLCRIWRPRSLRAATIARYTGLRLDQVTHIRREHIDLDACRLHVAKAKSRQEKAKLRTMALSPHLIEDLRPWLETVTGPLFPQRGDPSATMKSPHNLSRYVSGAWEAATSEGVVRRDVWDPRNRKRTTPNHCFRAAFQAHLLHEGVQYFVVAHLVGHDSGRAMFTHYADPPYNLQRDAVSRIPRVTWTEEALKTLQHGVKRAKPKGAP